MKARNTTIFGFRYQFLMVHKVSRKHCSFIYKRLLSMVKNHYTGQAGAEPAVKFHILIVRQHNS